AALTADASGPVTLVHLGQDIELSGPLPSSGELDATVSVRGTRPEARGTRVALRTTLTAGEPGRVVAELTTHVLLAGADGADATGTVLPQAAPPLAEKADRFALTVPVTREWIAGYAAASGDHNPIHLDPGAARAAGFPDVIAHGMSLVALAAEVAADALAGGEVSRVRALGARFARPVSPGEELTVELTPGRSGSTVHFTCRTAAGSAVKGGWLRLDTAPEGSHG
ncbi:MULTISPECIES: MaoC/PaaZ C-terminal domain-containing protein, partial [unclassified Streptomyces]|uniref:MaoC/PaaZ C-terminal domain-containing protein n=1 Tax=unclassified Streptomyces TaxID=2593676 RepID=UPI000CD5ABF7